MDNDLFKVKFVTSIDAYQRQYITTLPFRPQIGDLVPFIGQEQFPRLPLLQIISIEYKTYEYGFKSFVCNLWFNKNTHPDIIKKS